MLLLVVYNNVTVFSSQQKAGRNSLLSPYCVCWYGFGKSMPFKCGYIKLYERYMYNALICLQLLTILGILCCAVFITHELEVMRK